MIKKTFLSLVIAAIFFSVNLFAQNYPGDLAGAKADYLYKKLKLTNEQYASVYSIFLDTHMKMDGMMGDKKKNNMDNEQMKKMHDETMGKIEKVLTKDQLANWGTAKEKVCKVKPHKHVKKVTEEKKDDMNKDMKKEVKKEVKKEEKKDVKK